MAHNDNVQRLYALLQARWYNPFRKLWIWAVSRNAEEEFTRLLRGKLTPQSKILDLGCGTGINLGRIKDLKFKSYAGTDFSLPMLEIARREHGTSKKVSFAQGDIAEPAGSARSGGKRDLRQFNLTISTWVLSHLEHPSRTVNDYYKNLPKGGSMLLLFLTKPRWYIHFWFYPLARLFAARYVPESEITKFKGVKSSRSYSLGLATVVEVKK